MSRVLVLFLALLGPIGLGQELVLRSVASPRNPPILADVADGQGVDLSQPLHFPAPSAEPLWLLSSRWIVEAHELPATTAVKGNRVTVLAPGWEAWSAALEALGDFLAAEAADPDTVFALQELRLLEGDLTASGSLRLFRHSGEKLYGYPYGWWVFRFRRGTMEGRFRVRLQPWVPTLTATRPLARGQVLEGTSVRVEFRPLSALGRKPLPSQDLASRWTLILPVRQGQTIFAAQVQARLDVEARSTVNAVVERGELRVELPAQALEGGNAGQSIRVRLLAGERVLPARVVAPGEVSLDLP